MDVLQSFSMYTFYLFYILFRIQYNLIPHIISSKNLKILFYNLIKIFPELLI